MDETHFINYPSGINEMITLKDPPTESPAYVEVGSLRTVFPTHPTTAQVSAVLNMANHFKMNMILCGFWEKIDEETPEQLEEYENDECYQEADLTEALKMLERDIDADGPCDDSESCNVEIVFGETTPATNGFSPISLPYVFYEPKKPQFFEFTEEDKEEFRQMFAEEAKILMPHLRTKKRSEDAHNQHQQKFNEEAEATLPEDSKKDSTNLETMLKEIVLRTPATPLLPAGSRSSAINMPYSLDSSSIEALDDIRPRNYGTWYYLCVVIILVACAAGYVISRFFSASN